VLPHTNVMVAKVAGLKMLMITLKIKELLKLLNIHIPLDKLHAKLHLVNIKSKAMIWYKLETFNN
jgi:hypothetical protein